MRAFLGLFILFCLSLFIILSSKPEVALKQIISWIIGLGLFFIGRQISFQHSKNTLYLMYFACLAFLLFPILLNTAVRGSSRWLTFGFASLQPSEIVKPILLLVISNLPHLALVIAPVVITLLQPDLSGAVTFTLLAIPIILSSRKLLKKSLVFFFIFLLISPLIYKFGLKTYQQQRLASFINPESDPLGKGYNIIQSKIAIGSGGILGNGFKGGSQNQLKFLPERHTDFIFATMAEELGLIGVILLIVSYLLLFEGLISKYKASNHPTQRVYISGIIFLLWAQILANLGMNLGFLPVSGAALPFVSVGGSGIMAFLFSLGIVYSN